MKFKLLHLLFLYLIILCFALLKPFDFDFHNNNNAKWLQNKYGIRFDRRGLVISKDSTPGLTQILTKGKGLTLEVWLITYSTLQDGPARILSYSIDPYLRNFTLAQLKDKLIMRLRTEITDPNGMEPHVEVADIFEAKKIYHVIVTYNFKEECIFINGKKCVCQDEVNGKFSNWDPSSRLVIGNEVTGDRPWLGEIYYAAIYNDTLNSREIKSKYEKGLPNSKGWNVNKSTNDKIPVVCYLFNEKEGNKVADTGLSPYKFNLHIPDKLPVYKLLLGLPFFRDLHNNFFTIDSLFNVLGFIPFGFLLHRLIKKKLKFGFQTITIVLITGLSVSFGCEVLQQFLPSRDPSFVDVFTNMFGVSLGITIDKLVL